MISYICDFAMQWTIIIFTACVFTMMSESAPYGGQTFPGDQHSSGSDPSRAYIHPKGFSDTGFHRNTFWIPDYSQSGPLIHGPQVDLNGQVFRPPLDQIPPFGFGNGDFSGGPPRQNSFERRPQQGRQSVFLPPSDDYSDEVFIFDRPTSPRPTRPRPTTTTTATTTSATTTFRPAANCDCPSTPEFNPVCGSDDQTYNNPGKLKCAKFCGADVRLKYYGACILTTTVETTTTTSSTTPAPISRFSGRNRS